MRFQHPISACTIGIALLACGGGAGSGPSGPGMPAEAMLDAYDAAVLGNTAAEAPMFAEVASPHDEQPRRFRAWLGWGSMQCQPCPAGQDATCLPQCTAGKPYVCDRPGRMVACGPEDVVSMFVDNLDGPLPPSGVYIFEGRWRPATPGEPAAFAIERILPMAWMSQAAQEERSR
jgi:hypothetical protein